MLTVSEADRIAAKICRPPVWGEPCDGSVRLQYGTQVPHRVKGYLYVLLLARCTALFVGPIVLRQQVDVEAARTAQADELLNFQNTARTYKLGYGVDLGAEEWTTFCKSLAPVVKRALLDQVHCCFFKTAAGSDKFSFANAEHPALPCSQLIILLHKHPLVTVSDGAA